MSNPKEPPEVVFLEHLEKIAGREGSFHQISDKHDLVPLFMVSWNDLPEDGMRTSFTNGLSSVDFPEWKRARPELLISVASTDPAWGLALGYTAYRARGKYGFHTGETIDFRDRVSEESEMSAFWISPPLVLEHSIAEIDAAGRRITLLQLVPIYASELRWVRENGFSGLLEADFNPYDVARPPIEF